MQVQAERFYRAFSKLVRQYQFRDREEAGNFGISVSEWYPLEYIADEGPLTMGELVGALHLEASTATRMVDRLEAAGYVTRKRGDADRRVYVVKATRRGSTFVRDIQVRLVDEYRLVLAKIAPSARKEVIRAFQLLNESFAEREAEVQESASE